MKDLRLLGISMIVLQSFIYGLPDVFVKLVYQEFPVMTFLASRYAIASLFMITVWRNKIIPELKTVNPKHYLIPVLCMGSAFLMSNSALKYTTVSNVSFLRATTPIIAASMLMFFFNRKVTWRDCLTFLVLIAGMYLISTQRGLSFAEGFGTGEILSLICSTTMAGSLVFGKDALKYISPYTLTCLQCFASLIFCLLMGSLDESLAHTPWQLMGEAHIFLPMLYLALPCSVGGLLLQNSALKYINSKMISVIQCLYPIVASITAYIVIGEASTLIGIFGCGLVLLSVIMECFNRE